MQITTQLALSSSPFLGYPDLDELKTISPDALVHGGGCAAAVAKLAPHYRKSSRQDFALALSGTLLHAGVDGERMFWIIQGLCRLTNDGSELSRIIAAAETLNRDRHGQSYSQATDLIALIGSGGERVVRDVLSHIAAFTFTR